MGWLAEARHCSAEPLQSFMYAVCHTDVLVRLPDLLHTASLEARLCCQVMPALRAAQKHAYAQHAATESFCFPYHQSSAAGRFLCSSVQTAPPPCWRQPGWCRIDVMQWTSTWAVPSASPGRGAMERS